MTVFFSQLINGLSLGSIYALIALGYSMVYGIILLLNFAHGDVIMVGAYMSWFVMNQLGLGPVTAVCATIITCTLLGVVIEKIAYTPLRNAPRISLLITAIGVSFFLEYTAELIMGSGAKVIPAYYTNQTFRLGKVPLGLTSIITLAVTVLSMLVLTFLVQKTKLGKACGRCRRIWMPPVSWASTSTAPSPLPLPWALPWQASAVCCTAALTPRLLPPWAPCWA